MLTPRQHGTEVAQGACTTDSSARLTRRKARTPRLSLGVLPTLCNLKKNPFMSSCLTLSLLILHVLLLWQINSQRNAKKSFFQNIVCIFSIKHYHKDNEADQSIINMKRKQSCSSASCRTSAWNIVLDFFVLFLFKYFCGNNPCQRFLVLKYFCGTNLKGTTKPGWEGKECPSL